MQKTDIKKERGASRGLEKSLAVNLLHEKARDHVRAGVLHGVHIEHVHVVLLLMTLDNCTLK